MPDCKEHHASTPAYISNEEALALLKDKRSGLAPDLSKLGYRIVKRLFDIVASTLAIVVLAIPGMVLCVVICAKSPGASPIYAQWRLGRVRRDGSFYAFRMYKFRSMVPNADELLPQILEKNELEGPMFKMRRDPRVIGGVGSFIRRHSIDELPQLINVFLGQISLIGPRPALPREVLCYDEHDMRRVTVKPGCGGSWQVSGRNRIGFEHMVDMDIDYIEKRSLDYDLKLVFKTIAAMFSGDGAA